MYNKDILEEMSPLSENPHERRCIMPEEKPKVSKAQQKAVAKYMKNNYDELKIRTDKGQKSIIKTHAEQQGESMNSFVVRAINETMKRDSE